MKASLTLALCALVVTGGCSRLAESRFNPFNWFGSSTEVLADADTGGQAIRPLIPPGSFETVVDARPLVATVTQLNVNRTPDGAIVTATGVAATQGSFNAQLVPTGLEGGTLTLAFRAEVPAGFQGQGSARSRTLTAARVLSDAELSGVRSIRVQGASNARVVRR